MTTIDGLRASAEEIAEAMSNMILAVMRAIQSGKNDPQQAPEVNASIIEVLRTVGEAPMSAPKGVEFDMSVYLACDAVNASTCLHFPGNRMLPPRTGEPVDVDALLDSLPLDQRVKLAAVGRWRVMTREEITVYKVDQIRRTGRV